MPVEISYETMSGIISRIKLPVEIWNNSAEFIVKIPTLERLKKATIDPDKILPDVNFKNNSWSSEK